MPSPAASTPTSRTSASSTNGGEHADRVRAAADARDHAVGQPAGRARGSAPRASSPITRWRSRTSAGYGAGPDARADDVVGRLDVRDPVADRRRHRLLERRAPASTGSTRRAEQPHALDVRLLAAHVLGAHVDDALEVEQRAGGRRGDAVLAGAGLGDDPRLAHPLGQQRLAERVVDLVGAGVVEVLALEPDRVPGRARTGAGEVQRRRAADVVAQQPRRARRGSRDRRAPRSTPPRARRAPASASRGRTGRRRARSGARPCSSPRQPRWAPRRGSTAPDRGGERRELSGSLTPGARSTPLATSTAHGRRAAIASATLSGVSPPDRISGGPRRPRAISQANVSPVPPGTPPLASSRWKSVWNGAQRLTSARSRTRTALITLRRSAARLAAERRALVAVELHHREARARRPSRATRRALALTNTPASSTLRLIAARDLGRRRSSAHAAASPARRSSRSPRRRRPRTARRRRGR